MGTVSAGGRESRLQVVDSVPVETEGKGPRERTRWKRD